MRIISGEFRGRRLQAPRGRTTRPTTDRVRESLFSSLRSAAGTFDGLHVLDPFAGSGALGLEAVSRGAETVTFLEQDRQALLALSANIDALGISDRARVVRGDVFALVNKGILRGPYSLLLLDPPYTLDTDKTAGMLARLADEGAIADEALAAWEHASHVTLRWPEGFESVSDKKYGDTTISIAVYRKGPAPE